MADSLWSKRECKSDAGRMNRGEKEKKTNAHKWSNPKQNLNISHKPASNFLSVSLFLVLKVSLCTVAET